MLILTARFKTKPETREQMQNLAKGMLKPSNNEDGCISYEFFQNPFDNDSFIFIEKWRSRQDLELHFKMPYFKDFDSKVHDFLAEKLSVISYEIESQETII